MKYLLFPILFLMIYSCQTDKKPATRSPVVFQSSKENQDQLIKEYLEEGAHKFGTFSQDYQRKIDEGLAIDSTVAYFWQQKAMPLFKQGKYEIAMPLLDNAVKYDRGSGREWLEYRAFMKCIFGKRYAAAIIDFEDCKAKYGTSIVMDHSYDCYIAICYLQLNQFEKAEALLQADITKFEASHGVSFIHYLDIFYLGIAQYEQGKYEAAIASFDKSLAKYPNFADGQYYKALSHSGMGDKELGEEVFAEAMKNGKAGFTINEDNAIYERYPYQVIAW